MNVSTLLVFSFSVSWGPPTHARCHPHSQWVFPVNLNTFLEIPQRCAQKCVSMVILSLLKGVMKMNLLWGGKTAQLVKCLLLGTQG